MEQGADGPHGRDAAAAADRYGAHDLARRPDREDPRDHRHPFERDYDRLVHTSAFRRLQGTTGVVAPGESEHFRTRLTHTLEVAQLARRLGHRLGASPDVCEAAAIMHDVGHAPFGHVGEHALCDAIDAVAVRWGLDPDAVGGYEGNAQTFRLVTSRLTGHSDLPGLNLTRATLDAALKYPWARGEVSRAKWCFYPTEADEAARVRDGVPADRRWQRSAEAQVMDWADDVAYAVHDIEDFAQDGAIPLALLAQSASARERVAAQLVARRERRGKLADAVEGGAAAGADGAAVGGVGAGGIGRFPFESPRYTADELAAAFTDLFADPDGPFAGFRTLTGEYDGSLEYRRALRRMRTTLIGDLLEAVHPADPDAPFVRHRNDLVIPLRARLVDDVLRDLLWLFVIEHPRMATYQHGQRRVVTDLLELHVAAVEDGDVAIFPRDLQPELAPLVGATQDAGGRVRVLRLVADHVGGLTDDGAARLHRRLTGHVPHAFADWQ
ncbi:MAG: dNTP triphosphohydrolase [Actinomycetota bacterium]